LRVLERLDAGDDPLPRRELESTPQPLALPCLHVEPSLLAARIAKRIEVMLADGFEEEVRVLAARYPQLSHSAAGAIGYAEVLAMLRGEMEREVAMERIAARTRQLAKRQRTWFRNQAAAVWIDGPENELDAQRAGVELMKYWRQHGNVFTFG
jgi:tRNA dimethylallyltransferase